MSSVGYASQQRTSVSGHYRCASEDRNLRYARYCWSLHNERNGVPQGPLAYLTLWPDGQARPLAASLNALDGAITSNMAITATTNGSVDAYATNPTHLVLDLFGYFAPQIVSLRIQESPFVVSRHPAFR